MLEFVDKARAVSVYRRDQLTRTRTVVATITKISLNVTEEPTAVTTAEEALELTDFVKMRREAEAIERRLAVLKLPAYLREAIDFAINDANSFERRILVQCVSDANIRLKKLAASWSE